MVRFSLLLWLGWMAGASAQTPFLVPIGPDGGHFHCMANDSAGVLYAGTEGAGIFKSTNSGASWMPFGNGLVTLSIDKISASPTGTLFASHHGPQGTLTPFQMLYRLQHGKDRWEPVSLGLYEDTPVYELVCTRSGAVLVDAKDGLYRSTDDGLTWQNISPSLFFRYSTIDDRGVIFVHLGAGNVFGSVDDGMSWKKYPYNVYFGPGPITGIAAVPSGHLFVTTQRVGVFRSVDTAKTWQKLTTGIRDLELSCLASTPSGTLFTGTLKGTIYRSKDDGETWQQSLSPDTTLNVGEVLGILSTSSNGLFAWGTFRYPGTHPYSCIYASSDNGDTWHIATKNLSNTSVGRSLAEDPQGNLYVSTAGEGLFVSSNNGATWDNIGLGDWTAVLCCARSRTQIYAAVNPVIYRTMDGGLHWTKSFEGAWGSYAIHDIAAISDSLLYTFVNVSRYFPNPPATKFSELHRSTDAGATWNLISSYLRYGNSRSLLAYPPGHVLYSFDDSYNISTDTGDSWVIREQSPSLGYFTRIGDGTVFAMKEASILRSTDHGLSWETTVTNVPGPVNAFAVDARNHPFIAVADTALLASFDGGLSWVDMSEGLVTKKIRSLRFRPSGALLVGTEGGGLYISTRTTATQEPRSGIPEKIALSILPNPFTYITTISSHFGSPDGATISIFDAPGREVRRWHVETNGGGSFLIQWNGTDNFGTPLPSGFYMCRLWDGKSFAVGKIVLVR